MRSTYDDDDANTRQANERTRAILVTLHAVTRATHAQLGYLLHIAADAVGLLDLSADGDPPPVWRLHPCPKCGSGLFRIQGRLIDRLLHPVDPVHRYQCFARTCGWMGNLPAARDERLASPPPSTR